MNDFQLSQYYRKMSINKVQKAKDMLEVYRLWMAEWTAVSWYQGSGTTVVPQQSLMKPFDEMQEV